MPDIRVVQQNQFPAYEVSLDWVLLNNGTLDDRDALASAVVVALGTDRLAERTDIIPDIDSTDRRGWWADFDVEEVWDGWPIGSRLWLLRRDKITGSGAQRGSTLVRVEQYIHEALRPFLDRRIASQIQVRAERNGRDRIDAQITLFRGSSPSVELRYSILWDDIIRESFR